MNGLTGVLKAMEAKIEQWSIVITGQWNPHIFSAEWVAKNLLERTRVKSSFKLDSVEGSLFGSP